jgi:hypothetical protein
VLNRLEYDTKVWLFAATVTLPAPPWMMVQLNPTPSPAAQLIVVADPLVQ